MPKVNLKNGGPKIVEEAGKKVKQRNEDTKSPQHMIGRLKTQK